MFEKGDHEMPTTSSLMEGISQIKDAIADKYKQLSEPVKRWQKRSHTFVDTLTPESSAEDEREGSNQSLATMEKRHLQHLQEMKEIYETELHEIKEVFKNQMAAEEQRCFHEISKAHQRSKVLLSEQEKKFEEALRKKDQQINEKLLLNSKKYKRKMSNKLAKIRQQRATSVQLNQGKIVQVVFDELAKAHAEFEDVMKIQISDQEEVQKNMMAQISQLKQFNMRLEQMLEAKEMARLEQEEASNQNIRELQHEILKLKVSRWRSLVADFR